MHGSYGIPFYRHWHVSCFMLAEESRSRESLWKKKHGGIVKEEARDHCERSPYGFPFMLAEHPEAGGHCERRSMGALWKKKQGIIVKEAPMESPFMLAEAGGCCERGSRGHCERSRVIVKEVPMESPLCFEYKYMYQDTSHLLHSEIVVFTCNIGITTSYQHTSLYLVVL